MYSDKEVDTWNLCGYGFTPLARSFSTMLMRMLVYSLASTGSADFLAAAGVVAAILARSSSFFALSSASFAALANLFCSLENKKNKKVNSDLLNYSPKAIIYLRY